MTKPYWLAAAVFSAIGLAQLPPSIKEFNLPANSAASGISAGPDGALWFAEAGTNKIGRITTGGEIRESPVPTLNGQPFAITPGPDGALWFTEPSGNKIGRITIAGAVTEFSVPTTAGEPRGITAGPDSALWFAEVLTNKIGRITTAGVITEYPITITTLKGPYDITLGPDGALWFAASGGIGRVTPDGVFSDLCVAKTGFVLEPDPRSSATVPEGIAAGLRKGCVGDVDRVLRT